MNLDNTNPTEEQIDYLFIKGFHQVEDWKFVHDDILYDLSAANLRAVDYIVENKLFIVKIGE